MTKPIANANAQLNCVMARLYTPMLQWSASEYIDSNGTEIAPIAANPTPCQTMPRYSKVEVTLSNVINDHPSVTLPKLSAKTHAESPT